MSRASLRQQFTPALGREVTLREDTWDEQVWSDTFVGLYHLPSDDMPAPATVLDLGASIGLTAAHYLALWPDADIVAVEMDENSARLAEQNASGVSVRCHAVTGTGGWGTYDPSGPSDGFRFMPFQKVATGTIVSSLRLRQTIRRSFPHATAVDFVKMDVEGAEWDILAMKGGSWSSLVRHLLVELHPEGAPEAVGAVLSGRDGPDVLLRPAVDLLRQRGFQARPHDLHPRAVFAWRP